MRKRHKKVINVIKKVIKVKYKTLCEGFSKNYKKASAAESPFNPVTIYIFTKEMQWYRCFLVNCTNFFRTAFICCICKDISLTGSSFESLFLNQK